MDERTVRIRLKFQEPEILTSQQIEQGLAQSWYMVWLEDVHTIADVAFDIRKAFQLEGSCPFGLGLDVDGFVLPVSQPASLLKDSDLVRVKRRKDNHGTSCGHCPHETWNDQIASREHLGGGIHGFAGYHGVVCALDEFEKETGGYESEEEEEETETSLDGGVITLEEAGTTTASVKQKDGSGKKCKQAKTTVSKFKGQSLQKDSRLFSGDGVLCGGEPVNDGQQTVKRKKRKLSGSHPVDADVRLIDTMHKGQVKLAEANHEDGPKDETKTSRKKKKSAEVNLSGTCEDSGVDESVLKKGNSIGKVGQMQNGNDADLESPPVKPRRRGSKRLHGDDKVTDSENTRVKQMTPKSNLNGESTPATTPKDETNETQVDAEQRPSRSARRKKAKRQWLREQAKMAELPGVDTLVSESHGPKVETGGGDPMGSSIIKGFVEVEAEEEMLPIVVHAGHIRFEPLDEDETPNQNRRSLPVVHLGDQLKTKRQGQNWGQGKSTENRKGRRWATETSSVQAHEVSDDSRCNTQINNQRDSVNFEKLPPLEGVPKEQDVLAYRLVELTASWTPEISPYRVGVVAHWDPSTNMIKLDSHPDYPSQDKEVFPDDEEDFYGPQEEESATPYNENGSLEIELSSLVELRLIQRNCTEDRDVVPGPIDIGEELDALAARGHQCNHSAPVTEVTGISTSTAERQDVEDGERAERAPSWQALVSEELARKKLELSAKDAAVTNVSQGSLAPCEHPPGQQTSPKNTSSGSEGGKPVNEPGVNKGRKNKYLKSAGVGSIVALLRAQQAL